MPHTEQKLGGSQKCGQSLSLCALPAEAGVREEGKAESGREGGKVESVRRMRARSLSTHA
jgi:hypothetical protein